MLGERNNSFNYSLTAGALFPLNSLGVAWKINSPFDGSRDYKISHNFGTQYTVAVLVLRSITTRARGRKGPLSSASI